MSDGTTAAARKASGNGRNRATGNGRTSQSEAPVEAQTTQEEQVEFPLGSFKEAALHLRRPFPASAVKWKVQAVYPKNDPTGGIVVAYIDARLVIDRLNMVIPSLWSQVYKPTSDPKIMLCELTIDGITRSDVGESHKNLSKDLFSDALKRAAIHFGVGVSLYSIPTMRLRRGDGAGTLKHAMRWNARERKEMPTLELTPSTTEWLGESYGQWLEITGSKVFGEPLAYEEATAGLNPFAEHADLTGGEDEPEPPTSGPQFAQREEDLKAKDAPAGVDPQTGEVKTAPPADDGGLEGKLRSALALLGDSDEVIERRVGGASGNTRVLEVNLAQAEQRWGREHPDDPCPWAQGAGQ